MSRTLDLWRDLRADGPRRTVGVRLQARCTRWMQRLVLGRTTATTERLVWATMAAIDCQEVGSDALVTVIMPTHNRVGELAGAVDSVCRQSYPHWELVVIDDGSDDGTPDYLASLEDDRIRTLRSERAGSSAARNRGLLAAQGKIVAYLDDDNRMHPGWLRAVAWALTRSPQSAWLYGARLVEIADASNHGERYSLHFERFSRRRLRVRNFIDISTVAHRAELAGAQFDEHLDMFADWDLLLRITERHRPLELPVLACLYRTSVPGRISESPSPAREIGLIWERVHGRK